MALANTGVLLAQKGFNVLMIDWDLEAPGLERYFDAYIFAGDRKNNGLIEFLLEADKVVPPMEFGEENEDQLTTFYETLLPNYITPVNKGKAREWDGKLSLLRAGNVDADDYSDKIMSFPWVSFFNEIPSFFPFFSYFLKEKYDYVLIDSRTGHTDSGGVCTMLMPDSLVLAFIPNRQNLDGVLQLAEKASNYRKNSSDIRPLSIFPLPCRIEINEQKEREKWSAEYTSAFEKTLAKLFSLPAISLARYFETPIVQSTYYAFGEKIAVLDETVRNTLSLSSAYSAFVNTLTGGKKIWDIVADIVANKDIKNAKPKPKFTIIYAVQDEPIKKKLEKQLWPIKKQVHWESLPVYADYTNLQGFNQIIESLEASKMVVLLISIDLIISDAIPLITRHFNRFKKGNKLAIIVRPCLWEDVFERDKFILYPTEGTLSNSENNQDVVLKAVASYIKGYFE